MKTRAKIEHVAGVQRLWGVACLALWLVAACNMDFQTNTPRDGSEQFVDTNGCMPPPEGPYARMGFVMGNRTARGIGMLVENNDVLTLASVVGAIERRHETLSFKLLGSATYSEVAHVVLGCDFGDPDLNGESYCNDRPAQDWALLTLASTPTSCGRTLPPLRPSQYRWAPVADVSGEEVSAESFSFVEREGDAGTVRAITRSPCTVVYRTSGTWSLTWTHKCVNRENRERGNILIESDPDSSLGVLGLVPGVLRGIVGPRFDTFRDSPHLVLDLDALPDTNIPTAVGAVIAVERGSNALFIRSTPTQQPWQRFAVNLPGRNPIQIAHRGTEIIMLASDSDDQNCSLYTTSIAGVLAPGQDAVSPRGSLPVHA